MDTALARYNAYLQTLDDIRTGKLDLPDIDNQQEFAKDLLRYIRREFATHDTHFKPGNDYHKALWAFCVQRYLSQLHRGVFSGPDGFRGQKPAIAEAIDDHVNELLTNQMIGA